MKTSKIYGEENIESGAIEQYQSAMDLDWVTAGALMPDAHLGYSLPIGGVVATEMEVVPAWVGYDIGCGMCAVKTTFDAAEVEAVKDRIFDEIFRRIPVGFKHNTELVTWRGYANISKSGWFNTMFIDKKGFNQLGTLGGGNHFIEIGVGINNTVWIIVHSGSRNVGHTTATHYMREACYEHTGRRKAREGHYFLDTSSKTGEDYIKDLFFCEVFALENRREIVRRVSMAMLAVGCNGDCDWHNFINRNHNHIEFDDHFGVIHRKGATHARRGMLGVVPGNMRDGSFIVRGLGNPDSLYSSSHGAGRVLSRKKAKEQIDLNNFEETMQGIKANVVESTKDESPFAYKDIYKVMECQRELVEVIDHVKPMINVKG